MSPREAEPGGKPADETRETFDAPWQAEALALSVTLQDAGVVSAVEWAETLGRERNRPGLRADGSDYYASVIAALETLLIRKNLASASEIASLAEGWRRAAHATPHGRPIELENDPEYRPS